MNTEEIKERVGEPAKKDYKPGDKMIVDMTPAEKGEVKIIERIIENREIAPQDAFGTLTRPQIDLIKRTVAKGASDDELRLFIQVCKGANINPFLKQAHLVPFWDSKEGTERRAIIVGIDGFRAVAESSGVYAGNDDPVFEGEQEIEYLDYSKEKKKVAVPLKATVTVYKVVAGGRYGFSATVRWTEYYPGEKKGGQWRKMPYLMLGKCAEALALRKAFPKLLSGMYAQEEFERTVQADTGVDAQKAFVKLTEAIAKANIKELEDYKTKMQKSDKYTDDQKTEFILAVEARISELKNKEA